METEKTPQPLRVKDNIKQTRLLPSWYKAQPEPDEKEIKWGKFWAAACRRIMLTLGVTTAVTVTAYSWTLMQVREYEGKFQILVESVSNEQKSPENLILENNGFDYATQIEILRSPKVMLPLIKKIQASYPEITYDSLFAQKTGNKTFGKNNLSIERINNTKIIEVSYQNTNPEKIQVVLEQIASGYIKYSKENKKQQNQEILKFIQSQIPKLQDQGKVLQTQLQQLRLRYKIIEPGMQAQQLTQQMSQIRQQKIETETALQQMRSLLKMLQQQLGINLDQAIAASAISQDYNYQQLSQRMQEIENLIAIEKTRFTESHPRIQNLRDQQRNLLPLLQKESQRILGKELANKISNLPSLSLQDSLRLGIAQQILDTASKIKVLEIRNKAIIQAENSLNDQVKEFPVIIRKYSELQSKMQAIANTFNQLTSKRDQLLFEAAQQKQTPWEIISGPEIPRTKYNQLIPISPNLQKNLLYAAIGGLILGIIVSILAEKFNNVLYTPKDIKNATKLPVLGVIPDDKEAQFSSKNISAFQEAFRCLNTKLRLLHSDIPITSLTIASATSADGKSTVALHLALAAATMGQRVLLVDGDLRWPQLHLPLGLENALGLSNAIISDLPVTDFIHPCPVDENLFILTAGPIPPDPPRLLASNKMKNVMKQCQENFDLVIYDTPPLLGIADSSIISANTDGILLVVGLEKTDRTMLKQALEELKISGVNLIGVVANGLKGETIIPYSYIKQNSDINHQEITVNNLKSNNKIDKLTIDN